MQDWLFLAMTPQVNIVSVLFRMFLHNLLKVKMVKNDVYVFQLLTFFLLRMGKL